MDVVGDCFYLFGGSDNDHILNDIHCFEVKKQKWSKIVPSGSPPHPRSGSKSAIAQNNQSIYYFGGYTFRKGEYFNDLFKFDVETHNWRQIELQGDKISGRVDHTTVMYNNSLYIFGGRYPLRTIEQPQSEED